MNEESSLFGNVREIVLIIIFSLHTLNQMNHIQGVLNYSVHHDHVANKKSKLNKSKDKDQTQNIFTDSRFKKPQNNI